MTGRIGVACVYDPRPGQKVHIDADAVIEEGSALTIRVFISCRGDENRFADEQDSTIVCLEQAAVLRQGRLCLRFRAAYARECGRKVRG